MTTKRKNPSQSSTISQYDIQVAAWNIYRFLFEELQCEPGWGPACGASPEDLQGLIQKAMADGLADKNVRRKFRAASSAWNTKLSLATKADRCRSGSPYMSLIPSTSRRSY